MRASKKSRNANNPGYVALHPPRVLTEADFVESRGYLVPRHNDRKTCLLIIAHTNIYGRQASEASYDHYDAQSFVHMILKVAQDFPEVKIGLLDVMDNRDTVRRLPLSLYDDWKYAEAAVCLAREWHTILCDNETPNSARLWLLGILLSHGFRPTVTRRDLAARLAYEMAEPEGYSFSDARWDVPHFREQALEEAERRLTDLTEAWSRRGA